MRSASVGHQCVECVNEGAKSVRQPKTSLGGKPIVTYVLIAANVVMFVLQMAVAGLQRELFLWPAGIAAYDEFYRLLTSAFLHDGPTHILFNMWALWIIGPALERWLGRGRFVALYFLSALGRIGPGVPADAHQRADAGSLRRHLRVVRRHPGALAQAQLRHAVDRRA